MSRAEINIKPGGQISDVVENELGQSQHQKVINLEQYKQGEWRSTPGFKIVCDEFTSIKASIEVTEDRTGERFLLVQEGTGLKRVDYDISNSPMFGYENESSYTVDLPSGVEILSTTILRFFYFRGIVRITGAVDTGDNDLEVSLWYGYIEGKTYFEDAWSLIAMDSFEENTENWVGTNATLSIYDCVADADVAGMNYAPQGEYISSVWEEYALKIIQTSGAGYARKSFTVMSGRTVKVYLKAFRKSGGSGDINVKIGSAAGLSDYANLTSSTEDEWVTFEENDITLTSNTLYIDLISGSSGNTTYFDFIYIEENRPLEFNSSWQLTTVIDFINTVDVIFFESLLFATDTEVKSNFITINNHYDDSSQYTLQAPCNDNGGYDQATEIESEITTIEMAFGISFKLQVNIGDISNYLKYRASGLLINYASSDKIDKDSEDQLFFRVVENIMFNEKFETIIYTKNTLRYSTSAKARLLFNSEMGGGDFYSTKHDGYICIGTRIKIKKSDSTSWDFESTVTYIDYGSNYLEVSFADPIYPDLIAADSNQDIENATIQIDRKWRYVEGDGMQTIIGFEATGGVATEDYTSIPAGTESNTPQYSHHEITEKRAYVVSREDDEKDILRYSPINQFDNFPSEMIMATEVGDTDEIKALLKRDKRLCIMKGNSLSQGGYYNGGYSEDIGLAKRGIYSPNGFCVISNILYYLGKDDVYMFAGLEPKPLLVAEKLRNLYREYVSETSLLAYDLLNNRLWLILQNYILVFNPARNEWYERDIDMNPVCWFIDADQKLIICSSDKIVTFNHSETTFDESVRCYLKSSLIDDKTSEYWKKVNKGKIKIQASCPMKIKFYDPEEDTTGVEEEFTPETAKIDNNRISPKYHFKQLEFEMQPQAYHNDLAVIIRNIQLEIEGAG